MYDDVDATTSFRAELLNAADVSYLGPIFIGEPKSQGAMVVYDTGSDWLTVKSCFTKQHCNEEVDKEATMKKLQDAIANMTNGGAAPPSQTNKKQSHSHKKKGKQLLKKDKLDKMMQSMQQEEEDDADNDGDGILKPKSNPSKDKKQKKMEQIKTADAVYFSNSSMRGKTAESIAFPLSYGSAELSGFKM